MKVKTAIHKERFGYEQNRMEYMWLQDGRVYRRALIEIWRDKNRTLLGGIRPKNWERCDAITWDNRDFEEFSVVDTDVHKDYNVPTASYSASVTVKKGDGKVIVTFSIVDELSNPQLLVHQYYAVEMGAIVNVFKKHGFECSSGINDAVCEKRDIDPAAVLSMVKAVHTPIAPDWVSRDVSKLGW